MAHPAALRARSLGVPIMVDVDLLFNEWHGQRDFVFITGTNGKSTTTKLITHILADNHLPAVMGGNIGAAALSLPALPDKGIYVLELSSYQLERMVAPVPQVAVLLNLSFDHLERHDTMEKYLAIKTKIFSSAVDVAKLSIIGVDDEFCRAYYEQNKGRLNLVPISGLTLPAGGVGVRDGQLVDARRDKNLGALPFHPALQGPHNAQNMAAAYLVADYYGLDIKNIISATQGFMPLPHRQEMVASMAGVQYINDSKATNVDASLKSLSSFNNIRWLAGGQLKSGDRFADLKNVASHVTKGYFFGEGARKLQAEVMEEIPSAVFNNLAEALTAAHQDAQAGDVVLLSPVGASFDQYKNFEERGNDFKKQVLNLQK